LPRIERAFSTGRLECGGADRIGPDLFQRLDLAAAQPIANVVTRRRGRFTITERTQEVPRTQAFSALIAIGVINSRSRPTVHRLCRVALHQADGVRKYPYGPGSAWARSGDLDGSAAEMQKAPDLHPVSAETHRALARLHLKLRSEVFQLGRQNSQNGHRQEICAARKNAPRQVYLAGSFKKRKIPWCGLDIFLSGGGQLAYRPRHWVLREVRLAGFLFSVYH
jgi:hypothetical protein